MLVAFLVLGEFQVTPGHTQQASRAFAETGKSVQGRFLEYWNTHGGLAQQGYPISQELQEKSDTDGKVYTVQYFERAVFEMHTENRAPNDVLLSLLGSFAYRQKYPQAAYGQQANNQPDSILFAQTGYRVGGKFLKYWQEHGGLAQQGYPISDEFKEQSELDGRIYTVQYFERAVFEMHPENPVPTDVLLSQLGTFQYRKKYANGIPSEGGTGQATPTTVTSNPIVGQTIEGPGPKGEGRMKVTVTRAEETKTVGTLSAKNKYVVLLVDVENVGEEITAVGGSLALRDSIGRTFDIASYLEHIAAQGMYGRDHPWALTVPGIPEKMVLVFDVAADSTGYRLVPSGK